MKISIMERGQLFYFLAVIVIHMAVGEHSDRILDTNDLIQRYNYVNETHQIITEDGYILKTFRIKGSVENAEKYKEKFKKPVVLLQHGFIGSSDDFVLFGSSQSLAFELADKGYDVWLGNSRGNKYSNKHVELDNNDSDFWKFSWHELGIYDLPATIDYILKNTGVEQLFYVGHSQGCTSFLVMLSEKPAYNAKIRKAALLAPVANMTHTQSKILQRIGNLPSIIFTTYKLLSRGNFLQGDIRVRDSCRESPISHICQFIMNEVLGFDNTTINNHSVPTLLHYIPAGVSLKQFYHFIQVYKEKRFQKYDYGFFWNVVTYGQSKPPLYNLNNVDVPISIYYAENDMVADYEDVYTLADQLKSLEVLHLVEDKHLNHIGFLYSKAASELIYRPLLDYFK